MSIKGVEWKVTDRSIERLGVDIIVINEDGSRATAEPVRLDGNATTCMLAGLIQGIHAINRVLCYTEEFWERPGFHDVPKRRNR